MATHSFLEERAIPRTLKRQNNVNELLDKVSDFSQFNPFGVDSHISPINWFALKKIHPMVLVNNGPSMIHCSSAYLFIGTSNGAILVLNQQQLLQAVLTPHIPTFKSQVHMICINKDESHIAVGYQTGDIFIWNINSIIQTHESDIKSNLHITTHQGYELNGLSFLLTQNLEIISSDSRNQLWYHECYKTSLYGLRYYSKMLTNLDPTKNTLLTCIASPLVKLDNPTHLIAILTMKYCSIFSITHGPEIRYIKKLNLRHCKETCSSYIAWANNGLKLAYSMNTCLCVLKLEVSSSKNFKVSHMFQWESSDLISKIEWLSPMVLGVLTISNQFILLDLNQKDKSIILKVDLLPQEILTPSSQYFTYYNKKIFLLTSYSIKIGSFLSWTDIILQCVQKGNYIQALKTVGFLMTDPLSIGYLVNIDLEKQDRQLKLYETYQNLSSIAMKVLLQEVNYSYESFLNLFSLIMDLCTLFNEDLSIKIEYIHDLITETSSKHREMEFYDALSNGILNGTISSLSPNLLKKLMIYYVDHGYDASIETLIQSLDPVSFDIDLIVKLCQNLKFSESLIYLWNKIFNDYVTPLVDFIYLLSDQREKCLLLGWLDSNDFLNVFDYISFLLTGRQYPTDNFISSELLVTNLKSEIYYILFNGTSVYLPAVSSKKILTCLNGLNEPVFPYIQLLLSYNPTRFLSMLHEIFEDPFLNDDVIEYDRSMRLNELSVLNINREYIISILLDLIRITSDQKQRVLIAIFVTRNIPKYPQFIKLSGPVIDELILIICNNKIVDLEEESQQSLESLLTVYKPRNMDALVLYLKNIQFYRVLLQIYKLTHQYDLFLQLLIEQGVLCESFYDDFPRELESLLHLVDNDPLQTTNIKKILDINFIHLIDFHNICQIVPLINSFDSTLHKNVFRIENKKLQQKYIESLLLLDRTLDTFGNDMKYTFLELCYQNNDKTMITKWINQVNYASINKQYILDIMIKFDDHENIILLHQLTKDFKKAIDQLSVLLVSKFSDSDLNKLNYFINIGIIISNESMQSSEYCWVKLLITLLTLYSNLKDDRKLVCDKYLQNVIVEFTLSTKYHTMTDIIRDRLGNIVTNILEDQELILTKLNDLMPLLNDIFITYVASEQIQTLILKVIEGSSLRIINIYRQELSRGWSIDNHDCDVCGKRIWGIGIDSSIFKEWETFHINGKITDLSNINPNHRLVVFKCHHIFHEKCLKNMGQKDKELKCLTCNI